MERKKINFQKESMKFNGTENWSNLFSDHIDWRWEKCFSSHWNCGKRIDWKRMNSKFHLFFIEKKKKDRWWKMQSMYFSINVIGLDERKWFLSSRNVWSNVIEMERKWWKKKKRFSEDIHWTQSIQRFFSLKNNCSLEQRFSFISFLQQMTIEQFFFFSFLKENDSRKSSCFFFSID